MDYSIDLRYAFPLFTNFFFFLSQSYFESWGKDVVGPLMDTDHLIAMLVFLLVIVILTLVVLLTSVKLPLTITADEFRLQVGDFSAAVAIGLLCSIFLSPTHFWISYPINIATSPWYASLFSLLKRFLYWFYRLLQSIPTVHAVFLTQEDEHPQQEPPPDQVGAELA